MAYGFTAGGLLDSVGEGVSLGVGSRESGVLDVGVVLDDVASLLDGEHAADAKAERGKTLVKGQVKNRCNACSRQSFSSSLFPA